MPVFMVDDDLFEGSGALLESPELFDDLSVLKLLLERRRRSCKKEGITRSIAPAEDMCFQKSFSADKKVRRSVWSG